MKLAAAVLVLVLAAAGAVYWWLVRPQQAELAATQRQLLLARSEAVELKSRVADLQHVRDQLQRTSAELAELAAKAEQELQALRSTQDDLLSELKQEIADREIEVERIRDQIRVDVVDEILFDSGEATIKPAGVEVLRRVGAVLKTAVNRRIEARGHTDNVPIVDPSLLSAVAHSEYRPRASNDTEEGRRRNRRIEILLGPVITTNTETTP
jgi:chemotaxis protein MotB